MVRGLHASGFEEIMIWNTADLEKVDSETQVARIGGSVGNKKKEAIIEKAEELNIRILNPGVQALEDDFEVLEDEEEEFDEEPKEDENEYDEEEDEE